MAVRVTGDPKPKAKAGLLTADHSKRGRRFVTVLEPVEQRVTVLEPWEHAVLVLCDGSRVSSEIASLLAAGVEGEPVSLDGVHRCLKFFERQGVIEDVGLRRRGAARPAGPRTIAGLQQAYREWHKDPVRTGQILAGVNPPFVEVTGSLRAGLDPTVALPEDKEGDAEHAPVAVGSTLVLGDSRAAFADPSALRSVLDQAREPETIIGELVEDDPVTAAHVVDGLGTDSSDDLDEAQLDDVSALLAAVDSDFAELGSDAPAPPPKPAVRRAPPPVGRAIAGEVEIPAARDHGRPPANVLVTEGGVERPVLVPRAFTGSPTTEATIPIPEEVTRRKKPTQQILSEAALNPTMVGRPADGADEPIIISPPRRASSRTRPGDRVEARIGPEPSAQGKGGGRSRSSASLAELDTLAPRSKRPSGTDASLAALSTLAPRSKRPSGRPPSGTDGALVSGALVEDTQQIDTPTDAYAARDPRDRVELVGLPAPGQEDITTSQSSEHIHARARAVFERLRKAGLKARSYSDDALDDDSDGPSRRFNDDSAREFEAALESLTAGDLDAARAHFERLQERMPDSDRVAAFVEAIDSVRSSSGTRGGARTQQILDSFEDALRDAVTHGRCPKCFAVLDHSQAECFACGFETRAGQ